MVFGFPGSGKRLIVLGQEPLLFEQTPTEGELDLFGISLPPEAGDRLCDTKVDLMKASSSTYLWAFNSHSFVPRASPTEGPVPRLSSHSHSLRKETTSVRYPVLRDCCLFTMSTCRMASEGLPAHTS